MDTTEETQQPEMVNQAADTHDKKSPQESFAELRKAKEDLERQLWQAQKEREMYERQLQMQAQQKQFQNSPPQEEDFDFNDLEKEDFPDGKKLVKAFGKLDKKMSAYEQKLNEKEVKIQTLEFALENADFKQVVSSENIQKYIMNDEDLRQAVERSSNPLRTVYNLIKKNSEFQSELLNKAPKSISQEQKRVDEKELKPKTGSLGVRSEAVQTAAKLSNSSMSKEQRNALWKETQQAARK